MNVARLSCVFFISAVLLTACREQSLTSPSVIAVNGGANATADTAATMLTAQLVAGGGSRFAELATGTCALNNGLAYCWGQNVGSDTTLASAAPVAVAGGRTYASLTLGARHTCALTSDGQAWCWGDNSRGQLGDGSTITKNTPVPVTTAVRYRSIAAGEAFTCGISTSGAPYCWGDNSAAQLGGGLPNSGCGGLCSSVPASVPLTRPQDFVQVVAGVQHACALAADGTTSCWGLNTFGQTGRPTQPSISFSPDTLRGGARFRMLTSGSYHTCGLSLDFQKVFCWGSNTLGQLGYITAEAPTYIPLPVVTRHAFSQITAGGNHTCGMESGVAFCWGAVLVNNSVASLFKVPTQVTTTLKFKSLSAGANHTCGIDVGDGVYCWGSNDNGQLGDGTLSFSNRDTPQPVKPVTTFVR